MTTLPGLIFVVLSIANAVLFMFLLFSMIFSLVNTRKLAREKAKLKKAIKKHDVLIEAFDFTQADPDHLSVWFDTLKP